MICQYIKYLFGPPSLISDDSNSFQRKFFIASTALIMKFVFSIFVCFFTFCFLRATGKNTKK